MSDVTRLLARVSDGESGASDQLLELVYDELRRLAAAKLSNEKPGQTIQATALVHEAYLRLANGGDEIRWENRAHFFSAAAETMRRLLIDTARRKKTQKHGGGFQQVTVDLAAVSSQDRDEDLLALDHALEKLAAIDATKAKLVELRFFAGLTNEQAAKTLAIGVSTAESYWAYSRSWLRAEISRFRSS